MPPLPTRRPDLARRAVEMSMLAAFTVAVYAAIVVGGGSLVGSGKGPNVPLAIAATALVAVAFSPMWRAARRLSGRLAYGGAQDPYEVLARAAREAAATLASGDGLHRMAEVIARGTGAARAEVWLRSDRMLRREAAWPERAEGEGEVPLDPHGAVALPAATRSVAVVHHGRVLGAIAVYAGEQRRLGEVEEMLLEGLASQAGLALRNAALAAELRRRVARVEEQAREIEESRRRILVARDEERRRLQREIHDGAQQHLVSLVVKLRLAKKTLRTVPGRARELLADVRGDVDNALSSLRDIARGIHPAVLSDGGIAAAIEAYAGRLPVRVLVDDRSGGRRFGQAVETGLYFCSVEALKLAVREATVRLDERDGALVLEVSHDGDVDVAAAERLQDRAATLDADVRIAPGMVAVRVSNRGGPR